MWNYDSSYIILIGVPFDADDILRWRLAVLQQAALQTL